MRNERHGLGEYILKAGLLNPDILEQAILKATNQQVGLSTYLVKQRLISNEALLACCRELSGLPVIKSKQISTTLLQHSPISTELQYRYRFIVIEHDDKQVKIALADPTQHATVSAIGFQTGLRVAPYLIDELSLDQLLHDYCRPDMYSQVERALSTIQKVEEETDKTAYVGDEDAPIIKLVNRLIKDAQEKRISDIHIEPQQDHYRVRYRRDGLLYIATSLPYALGIRIATRLKILGKLDIAEKRLPQDGKILFEDETKIDIRLSTCPTTHGEKLALRLLETLDNNLSLNNLGLDAPQLDVFKEKLAQPQGLILVTGPTGSGKTRTLYAALQYLNHLEKNIATVEDPVEIELPGINQVNINPAIGLDFATALRAFLRQDPDIMMIGEIRDSETAHIALQAAQTGHLVLSTMHTNHAAETMTRLQSMGVNTNEWLNSIELIIAQRLLRKKCQECLTGCDLCHQGYNGRIGIFEMLSNHQSDQTPQTLWQAGLEKVKVGITSHKELVRVLGTAK